MFSSAGQGLVQGSGLHLTLVLLEMRPASGDWRSRASQQSGYYELAGIGFPAAPKERKMNRKFSHWLGLAASGVLALALAPVQAQAPATPAADAANGN